MHRLYILFLFTLCFLSAFNGLCQKVFKQKDGSKLELLENGEARYYDKKGNLIGEGKLKDFKKNGTWKYYKDKGKLYAVENYNMHDLEGQATYYYPETMQLKATGKYKDDKRDGEWKFYSYNRLLYNSVTYSDGKVHGPAVYYDTIFAGHKIGEGKHYEGKRTGKWMFYTHRTGKMHGIEHYENGLMEGPANYYDTINTCDGPVCTKIADGQYEKNLRVGIWTFYFTPSGKVSGTETYKDSIMNGPAKYYCESTGKLISDGSYKNGLIAGNWSFYDSISGRKLYELAFVNDEDTATIEFFEDNRGYVRSIQRYKGEIFSGDHEQYDSLTGNLLSKFTYQDDVLTGLSSYKDGKLESYSNFRYNGDSSYLSLYNTECGHKTSEGFYKDTSHSEGSIIFYFHCSEKMRSLITLKGQKKYIKHFDSAQGRMFAEGASVNDKRTGEWKYYYPNSKRLYATVTYKNDVVEGPGRYYDSLSGKVLVEGSFKQGNRDGRWIAYNVHTGKPVTEEAYKNGELQGKQIVYDTTGNIFYSYNYKNGLKNGDGLMNYYGSNIRWVDLNYKNDSLHGTLRSYYRNGKLKREEKYGNGHLISAKCYTPDGDTTEYYPIIIQPQFEEDVMNYIGRNLQYPQEAKETRTEGKVVIRFKITETGMVSGAEIIKSAGHGMDEEALRLITRMPPWEPAYFDGISFETYKTLPIVFWLHDDIK